MKSNTDKSQIAFEEEKILEFWKKNNIFQKTLDKVSPKGEFVFYEGPPTANGKPGIHHIEARSFKDIIPRFRTMQGFHVRRKGGWDTHGLPVELQVEKQLGLKSKKEIEDYGIEAFNKKCKESVWEYVDLWEKFTERMGYWVDQENPYITYENSYIESVWNVLKVADEKKLLYKDYKVLPWCPRCGTALSSHELAQGYQDDKDLSVTVKFKIKGEENTFILAWTTTPWTLPGNVALAVGDDIDYVKIKIDDQYLILAKERLSVISSQYEIISEMKGREIVGIKYEPLYPFLKNKFEIENKESIERSYRVYLADFVSTLDGTGVVHTAVMYGQDDFVLGTKIGLPKFHLVREDGTFLNDMDFLSNRFVKDDEVAIDIIKDLAHRNLLYKKERYEHSYPHCWRCKTALIYYARDSWYISMSKLREDLVSENNSINWEPHHIKDGRFGEWIREVKDWAISRERYWGTPLPVWQGEKGNYKVVSGISELKSLVKKSGNKYILLRHGQGDHNVRNIISCVKDDDIHLTEKGKKEVENVSKILKGKSITKIISSPFIRTKETTEIVKNILELKDDSVVFDERLSEHNLGDLNGKSVDDYHAIVKNDDGIYEIKAGGGENLLDIKIRTGEFIYDIDSKYQNEVILIVTHEHTAWALSSASNGYNKKETIQNGEDKEEFLKNGEIKELEFIPLPHNQYYELDLHRPFIDEIILQDMEGNLFKRTKEVIDVWMDSGAMPFAQDNYPFSTNNISYPADFISEAIDQTRGWFYTLHAVGVIMGKGMAFRNVICLGHILDSQGKKMSKSLGNIVDPWEMIDKYGVDALRLWMYSVNQPGDSKNFDEKTVDEIIKKTFNPVSNIVALYEMYENGWTVKEIKSENILDKWIISRLGELIKSGTEQLENYKLFEPTRSIKDFINDLSTWYIRRSRERFKSNNQTEKDEVFSTTRIVLTNLAKYMAPFTPFFAEELYQKFRLESDPQSVHLSDWPDVEDVDYELIRKMSKAREIVSLALDLRQKADVKVRQPLQILKLKEEIDPNLLTIVQEEVNVKNIEVDSKINGEIFLETSLSADLLEEGFVRDFIRAIQDARKKENLIPADEITITASTNKNNVISKYKDMIISRAGVKDIDFVLDTQGYKVESSDTTFSIKKYSNVA